MPPQLVGEGLPELDIEGAVIAKGDWKKVLLVSHNISSYLRNLTVSG